MRGRVSLAPDLRDLEECDPIGLVIAGDTPELTWTRPGRDSRPCRPGVAQSIDSSSQATSMMTSVDDSDRPVSSSKRPSR